jgi:hypothetical protein
MKNLFVKPFGLLITCLAVSCSLFAQDPRLTQFEKVPLLMNPAFTGMMQSNFRVGMLGSMQSAPGSTLNHNTFFIEKKIEGDAGDWGFGGSYYSYGQKDYVVSGSFYSVSAARHFYLDSYDQKHWLSIGAQFSAAMGRANPARKNFDSAMTGGGFRYDGFSEKTVSKKSYLDINVGVAYQYKSDELTIESGIGLYHLMAPQVTFDGEGAPLRRRITFNNHINIHLDDSKNLHIRTLYYREGLNWLGGIESAEFAPYIYCDNMYSVTLESGLQNNLALEYGLATRNGGTIIPKFGLTMANGLGLMASYETLVGGRTGKVKRAELSVVYAW